MAKVSLYQFYRAYFNYKKGSNKYYARAVAETNEIFKEVLEQKSIMPLINYQGKEFKNPITPKLVENLVKIAEEEYKGFAKELEFFESVILIDKKHLSTRRRGIFVNVNAGIDRQKERMIFLVYGSSFNIQEEASVLRALLKNFPLTKKSPVRIRKIAYWNLSKGEVTEIDTDKFTEITREQLIEAANRI